MCATERNSLNINSFIKKFDEGSLTRENIRQFFTEYRKNPKICVLRICDEPEISRYSEEADRSFAAIFRCDNRYFRIEGWENLLTSEYTVGQITEVYPHKKMITIFTDSPKKPRQHKTTEAHARYVPFWDPELDWTEN